MLARSAHDPITAVVFLTWQQLFELRVRRITTYEGRDRIMALFAPIALLSLPIVWLTLTSMGYTLIYWGLRTGSIYDNFAVSGSAITTLGFGRFEGWTLMIVTFSEASMGLILVALLISYLPTMYSAFSARENAVTLLEVRAGSPPSAVELITRAQRVHELSYLRNVWEQWETWFAAVEESHTSLAALVFFRSPRPERHWVTAAGTVLDAAALVASTVDTPRNPQADLCIRAGYLALRSIADFFEIRYNPAPRPDDPISISRDEFDAACAELTLHGVPLHADRDKCWRDYCGWRVNYDVVLLRLAALTMAPYAPWISDRSVPGMGRSTFWRRRRRA